MEAKFGPNSAQF